MSSEASDAEVLYHEDQRFAATASGDLNALDLLLSDELHYVHANGMAEAKREFLPPLLGVPRD
jgi:hypothetical protein